MLIFERSHAVGEVEATTKNIDEIPWFFASFRMT